MADALWYVLTFLAGLGAGVVLKISFDMSKRTATTISGDSQGTVQQRGNTVGGHMSGRDVNVKRD